MTRRTRLLLAAFFVIYTVGGALVGLVYMDDSERGLFKLCCWMGPLISELAQHGEYQQCALNPTDLDRTLCLHASRMPVIPLVLAAVAKVYNALWFAAILKNALVTLPIGLIAWRWTARWGQLQPRRWMVLGLFGLSFPGMIIHHFYLGAEESVLIGLFAFVFGGLPLAQREAGENPTAPEWGWWIAAALVNALIFLTKAGMLPLTLLITAAYALITRRVTVLLLFALPLSAAVFGWGLFTRANSGQFALGTSLDGYNLSKGNNEYSLEVYRDTEDLDVLSNWLWQLPASEGKTLDDEWDFNAYFTRRAFDYVRDHPGDTLNMLQLRFFKFYLSVNNPIEREMPGALRFALKAISLVYMLGFRLMLWGGLFYSVVHFVRRGGPRAVLRGDPSAVIAAAYTGFVLLYSAPYLVGFAYWRHVAPLVLPTVLFVMWISVTSDRRPGKPGPAGD